MEEYREKTIDLREYFRVFLKRRWIIITVFAVVVLFTAIATFTATPVYQTTAQIVIEKENPNLVSIEEVMAVDSTGTDYYQTQYKIIRSRTVAREVIRRLDLKNSPEFFPPPKDNILSDIWTGVRDAVSGTRDWIGSLLKTGIPKDETADQDAALDSELVSRFIERIQVSPIENSRLVNVGVEAKDPAMSARMTNELVHAYIDQNLETKLTAAKNAAKWLGERIDDMRQKVEAAEKALLNYKEEQQIITDFSSDAENITAQKLAELNTQLVEAESQRVEAETRYRQAISIENSPDMLDSIPEVLSNDLVKEVKKMEVVLFNSMSELSKKYGRNHPKMVAIESELAELKKRKQIETGRVINSLKNKYKLALAREESLKAALARQKAESLSLNKKAVQYSVFQREAESSRNMYDMLIKRFKETSLTEEMKTGNIRIIDTAETPKDPVKPNKKRNLLLAVILGTAMGFGLALFLEYLDNTIKLPDEIKEDLNIPFLGAVPAFSSNGVPDHIPSELVTVYSPNSAVSEAYRSIRTGILFSSADTSPQVIMVTSVSPLEGKTTSAANLSVTLASAESRVLLIDADMRRPRVHKVFGLDRKIGLSNVLVGTAPLKNAITASKVEGLDILPVGSIPPNPSEIIGSRKMEQLLDALRENYARVIIDTPPIVSVSDALVLSRMVDRVLLVIRSGETPRPAIQSSLAQLQTVNAKIMGAVLNAVGVGRDSYYYYQYSHYYYAEDSEQTRKKARVKNLGKHVRG